MSESVLVVEYGYFDDNSAQVEPSSLEWTTAPGLAFAAAVVGGGSTINGMLFDRGAADYDIWERLHNPGWGWKALLPYFKKSTTFTPPGLESSTLLATLNGRTATAFQANFPDWQRPGIEVQWQARKEPGMPINTEGAAAGNAWGAHWNLSATDNQYRRSHSRTGYWDPAATHRSIS